MKYVVLYGNGTYQLSEEVVEVDYPTSDYGMILDMAIDQMEKRGETEQFLSCEEIEEDGIYGDEYITGGNHGLNLYHGGHFMIKEIKD